jgi:phosphoglycolate phosphatase
MLHALERPDLEVDLIRSFVGKGISNLVERTLAAGHDGPVDAPLISRALEIFERYYSTVNGRHTTVYPGVREGLDRLSQRGFPLACVTNKLQRYTLPLLRMTGLAPYFEHVVAGDTLARKKPDPAPLVHACDALGIAPAAMLMIGDSENDTAAARAAGCPVFCVTYGYSEGRDVRDLGSDALVDSLVDAAGLIEKDD